MKKLLEKSVPVEYVQFAPNVTLIYLSDLQDFLKITEGLMTFESRLLIFAFDNEGPHSIVFMYKKEVSQ